MRITYVPMIAQLIASLLHIVLGYHFVFEMKLGVRGLGLAISIANLIKVLIIVVFIACETKIRRALAWPSCEAFKGWFEYLGYSLPVIIILGSEWWAYELMTILAGLIGVEEQASWTIVSIICSVLFEFPLAVSEVTSSLVGNCIGAGNVDLAKRFFRITMLIGAIAVLSIITLICLARHYIVGICTTIEEV